MPNQNSQLRKLFFAHLFPVSSSNTTNTSFPFIIPLIFDITVFIIRLTELSFATHFFSTRPIATSAQRKKEGGMINDGDELHLQEKLNSVVAPSLTSLSYFPFPISSSPDSFCYPVGTVNNDIIFRVATKHYFFRF